VITTGRRPFLVTREYVGVIGIIAGITHAWPPIPAIVLGCALVAGIIPRVVAALAFALLIAYTVSLHLWVLAPSPPAAYGFLALTVALTSTNRVLDWDLNGTTPLWTVVPLRLYFGFAFWRAAWNKIGARWAAWPDALQSFGTMQLPHESAWYRAFMTSVVFPHAQLFAGLVAVAEVAVGTCLLLGLGVRFAAPVGVLLTLNYFLLKGDAPWSVSNDLAFALGLTILTVTGAGRVLGLDSLIAPRHPVEQPAQGD
jgi:thiosulfate dehydrogenase (quinone) large subunit